MLYIRLIMPDTSIVEPTPFSPEQIDGFDSALRQQGWAFTETRLPESDFSELSARFEAVIDAHGSGIFAETGFDGKRVVDKRGGNAGYKRVDDLLEHKDTFKFHPGLADDIASSVLFTPPELVEFLRHGQALLGRAAEEARQFFYSLEQLYPGFGRLHIPGNGHGEDDFFMRTLLYDRESSDDEHPFQVVAEPHLDISTLTFHYHENTADGFFVIEPDGTFRIINSEESSAIVFPSGGLIALNNPKLPYTPRWHGAVAGRLKAQGDKRRAVNILLANPSSAINTSPAFEDTHTTYGDTVRTIVAEALKRLSDPAE